MELAARSACSKVTCAEYRHVVQWLVGGVLCKECPMSNAVVLTIGGVVLFVGGVVAYAFHKVNLDAKGRAREASKEAPKS